jgi:Leucine-rich repeat (LRR) protein
MKNVLNCSRQELSDLTQLDPNLKKLIAHTNCFVHVPLSVFTLTRLDVLNLFFNRISSIAPDIGRLTTLTELGLGRNRLTRLPREIGRLKALRVLELSANALECVPKELADLQQLEGLQFDSNLLRWLPIELARLPTSTFVALCDNVLSTSFYPGENARLRFVELFCATTHIGMIRERATTVCIALQDLELPAPLTLEIIDALLPNNIRMWAKWELITVVKHFHTVSSS